MNHLEYYLGQDSLLLVVDFNSLVLFIELSSEGGGIYNTNLANSKCGEC